MPLQRDKPRAREKPRTALSVCQKVIVKKRKSRAAKFLHVLLMFQSSSSKLMTTLMLAGRPRNFQDLVFTVQSKGFGAGVVSDPPTGKNGAMKFSLKKRKHRDSCDCQPE